MPLTTDTPSTEPPRSHWIGGQCTIDAVWAQIVLHAKAAATKQGRTLERHNPALFNWQHGPDGARTLQAALTAPGRRRTVLEGANYAGLNAANTLGLPHAPLVRLRRTGGGRMSPSPATLLDECGFRPGQCVAVAPKDVVGTYEGLRVALRKRQLDWRLLSATHGLADGWGRIWLVGGDGE